MQRTTLHYLFASLLMLCDYSSSLAQSGSGIRQTDTVSVYFQSGKASILSSKELIQQIEKYQLSSTDRIVLYGFTDSTGSIAVNKKLASQRMIATLEVLHQAKITCKTDTINQFNSKSTTRILSQQRRVDIVIYREPKATSLVIPSDSEKPIVLNINFEGGTDNLINYSYAALDQLAETLKRDTLQQIELHGHTCCGGNLKENLSLKRAQRVSKYLVRRGVSKNRIVCKGFENTRPLKPETSEENKAINRRVEVIFKKKS